MSAVGARPPADDGTVERAAARILAFGRAGLRTRPECSNVASAIGVAQYVAIAAEVAGWLRRGRVLDWGAGWGQNALLLRALGLDVVAYDVEDKAAGTTGLLAGLPVPYVVDPRPDLPFGPGAFDAVLNCGVLEHVDDERGALRELFRVLRPEGRLFTYHLPNRHAYTEWLGRRLGRFHHERTYSRGQAIALFERGGFRVVRCRPFHVLPRNVWGRLSARVALAGGPARAYEWLDGGLTCVPGVRRLATAWAVVAERPR